MDKRDHLDEEADKRKRVLVELGVSLALIYLRDALAKVEKLDHVDADMGGFAYTIQEGSLVYLRSIEAMLAQENLEAIMATCRLGDET